MYGLVNQAIRKMVLENFGDAKWEEIRKGAEADDDFVGMEQYPDSVTIGLVGSACAVLGAQAPDVLRTFGRYWVGFTGEAYGPLFDMAGSDFVEFIKNLNDLHSRVGAMMPELQPPSFTVSDEQPGSFVLHYHSSRGGLTPMILGLIEGLGERFETTVEITYLRGTAEGLDHDEFLIKHTPAA